MLLDMRATPAIPEESLGLERRRFTVDELERMIQAGLFAEDEPVQLIEGELIVMSPQGPEHSAIVGDLGERLREAYSGAGHVRSQCPLRATATSLPEPDLAVVRGAARDYLASHPTGEDALLVVEIAMTSQAVDQMKARVYAAAGVPEYWLLDLAARCLHVHRELSASGYAAVTTLREGEIVSPPGRALRWRVSELLP